MTRNGQAGKEESKQARKEETEHVLYFVVLSSPFQRAFLLSFCFLGSYPSDFFCCSASALPSFLCPKHLLSHLFLFFYLFIYSLN
jgi:hypothetical protein